MSTKPSEYQLLVEQGEMKKECKFGLLTYDNGDTGVLGIVFEISIATLVKKLAIR